MGMVILSILKIIGIILLVVLGLILLLLLLVLFVPIRYRIDASKDAEGEQQIHALVKVTWLLHLLNIRFLYPEEAYLRVRIACFTLFRSDQPAKEVASAKKNTATEKEKESEAKTVKASKEDPSSNSKEENFKQESEKQDTTQYSSSRQDEDTLLATEDMEDSGGQSQTIDKDGWKRMDSDPAKVDQKKEDDLSKNDFNNDPGKQTGNAAHTEIDSESVEVTEEEGAEEAETDSEESPSKWELLREKIIWCIQKFWGLLKNIRYTIQSIYDKIRNIIHHIRYYYKVLRSDLFHRTWEKCSKEALHLLKSIAPRKVKGYLHIGMEDPATTGQILGYYGMLYPLIGGHIDVIPDFDQVILEGTLKIRGHITLFQAVRTACIIYFNKDLRKLIKLLKREVA